MDWFKTSICYAPRFCRLEIWIGQSGDVLYFPAGIDNFFFSVKGQISIANILRFANPVVSVMTAQLCHDSTKIAIDDT